MSFHYSKALTVAISLISASGLISGTVHANPADAALQQLPPGLEDLPPGRVRDKIASLPPAAQKQALNWLQRFSIPEQDYDHVDVDPEGGIFYIDEKTAPESSEELPSPESGLSATDTFTLHSKPGASNIIYLDVDGHTIEGTIWNGSVSAYHAKPFDRDGSPYTYSQSELDDIAAIWHRVAEDYAAFDVDVTTEAPAQMGPTVGRILITHNTDENGTAMPHSSAGGVAYLGVWGRSNYTYYQPALVYYNNLGGGAPRYVSEAASHEMGHNQGLGHDGTLSGSAYYNGHGSGYTRWGPIMGVGYNTHVSQWSKGDYNDANNTQDDFGIIAANVGLRPDDHGDDISSASALEIDGAGQIVVTTPENDPANYYSGNKGVISSRNDIDVFEIISGEGTINVTVTPAWLAFNDNYARGANLDIKATLLNAQGQALAQSSPTTDTYAEIQYQASAGAYYLTVTGVGDTPSASTYDDYGSQGLYYISGSISPNQSNNNAPEAQNDSASTTEDQAINIAVLSNDSDIDGDT
ncbi:MAG: hypothetical protein MI864_10445, partial [Pseudomonadales bacterium]|nr:hypothetical protein [Pseudomonadales bacterium]